uniref:Uncharacterized protein n=1 Tax=Sphenodon punctatus TaxID=8508 RepID=A0A8D0H246_SPHPU
MEHLMTAEKWLLLVHQRLYRMGFEILNVSQDTVGGKRQKFLSEFEGIRQFLEEQQRLLLARLGELETEIGKRRGEDAARCSKEISHLDTLIREMEGQFQQPASQFLQDAESSLSRGERKKFQQPEDNSLELDEKLRTFSQQTAALQETLQKFKDSLPSELEKATEPTLASYRTDR